MPSYTTSLRLVQPSAGEYPGSWGDEVNNSLTALVDKAVAGTTSITMTAANYTLTNANGVADEAKSMFLVLGGTPGASYQVIVPSTSKLYFVTNSTGFAQTVKTSAGSGVSVPNGARMALRCDGTDVLAAQNYFASMTLGTALPVASGGTGATTSTGTGAVVLATSPTLVTPALGTPASGNFSSGSFTWPTFNQNTTGTASNVTGTVAVANGGTGLTSYTSGGVVYASSTSALATGSALTFDGNLFTVKPTNTEFVVGSTFAKVENKAGASANLILADTTDSATLRNIGSSLAFLTSASEQMRLTSTGLGIGTSSPATKLDVNGFVRIRGASQLQFFNADNTSGASIQNLGVTSTDALTFNTTGSERMRLDSSGNLGIGTSSPQTSLDVRRASGIGIQFLETSSGNTTRVQLGTASGIGYINADAGSGTIALGLRVAGAQLALLDSSGNLGIGTSSPTYKLDIQGVAGVGLQIYENSTGTNKRLRLTQESDAVTYNATYSSAGNAHAWQVGNTEFMRLDSSGNLGLGVTPSASTLPTIQTSWGIFSGNEQINIAQNAYYDSAWKYTTTAAASLYFQDNGAHNWFTAPSGTAGNAITFTQAMTLDSNSTLSLPGKEGYAPLVIGSPPTFNNISSGFPGALISNNTSGFGYLGASGNSDVRLYANGFYGTSANHVYGVTGQAAGMYNILQNVHQWFNAPSGTAGNAISFTQAMTLDASGNLGVGTTSPTAKLTINDSAAPKLNFTVGGSGERASIDYTEVTSLMRIDSDAAIAFNANNVERARITSTGNVVAGGSVALATTATDGFLYVPTCAGTPTGTPTAITGMAPIVVNTTNNKLYFYSGGAWRDAGP